MVAIPLRAVNFVLNSRPEVTALDHVTSIISSYLDGSGTIALVRACEFGSIRLLDRIWDNRDPGADKGSSWSLCWYLRSDVHYYRYQFAESLRSAAERGDFEIFQWVMTHFSRCTAGVEVVEAAARCGRVEILQFLLDYESQKAVKDDDRNTVVWGGEDMSNAVEGGHAEVARWLYENTPDAERDLSRVMEFAVKLGDLALIQWLLDVVYKPELLLPPPSLNDAAAGGHMDVVKWVFDHGYYGNSDRALEGAAKNGRLDMVEWFVGKWITKGAREALQVVCTEGHLAIVRSIMERKLVQYPHFAMNCAVHAGHLDIVEYLSDVGISLDPSKLIANAASSGHLHLVKWLIAKFGETATLFPAIDDSRASWVNNSAMNRAASNGHLHVLEFLQSLVDEMQAKGKKEYPMMSNCALSSAAIMGHFEIVKWIRNQYPDLSFEPHTTTMIARNGNLEMLKWLQQQPNVEWPTDAMDSAAENGHLAVLKWLHKNRSEGCTSAAMNYAARNGHFDVVRWLHHNRSERGTSAAMDFAASGGYFELMFYLRDQCELDWTSTTCSTPLFGYEQRQPHIEAWLEGAKVAVV